MCTRYYRVLCCNRFSSWYVYIEHWQHKYCPHVYEIIGDFNGCVLKLFFDWSTSKIGGLVFRLRHSFLVRARKLLKINLARNADTVTTYKGRDSVFVFKNLEGELVPNDRVSQCVGLPSFQGTYIKQRGRLEPTLKFLFGNCLALFWFFLIHLVVRFDF